MLAENPLLLTVITALHRYERLPDKRVLIYDRCADLLLETWAKIKGTHSRWKEMKMVKEDQYACLAHLGFLLHSQTQEVTNEDVPCDITARVMTREIERFLKDRNLIAEGAELRTEAKSFLELIQVEAGLIVERGTEENGEVLYSFVHRTFQEYFAAAHIYEQFQQLVDVTVVRDFLKEHLHDPQWHEVTLLLLAKLKSRPVSDLLRQLLQGTLITRRSQATSVIQQDLYFSRDCLAEEIVVENDVATLIIGRLEEVIKKSSSLLQRKKALMALCTLMKTRQYASQSKKTIIDLAITDGLLEFSKRIEVLQILYSTMPDNSEEKQLALDTLTSLLQRPELSFEQTYQAVKALYSVRSTFSQEQAIGMLIIKKIAPYINSFFADVFDVIGFVENEPNESKTRQLALDTLTSLLQHPELSFEQTCQVASVLAASSLNDSEESRLALDTLTSLLQRPELSFEQTCQAAFILAVSDSEKKQLALDTLTSLLQHPELSFEQTCQVASVLAASDSGQLALDTLTSLLQRPELFFEQTYQVTYLLSTNSSVGSKESRLALDTLTSLLQYPELSFEQTYQVASALAVYSTAGSEEERLAASILISFVQDTNLVGDWGELAYDFLSRMVPQFDQLKIS